VATKENPKLDPSPISNTEKNPDDWVSGDEPMTGAQASYLKTLSEQLDDADAFDPDLSKAEAIVMARDNYRLARFACRSNSFEC
jgi:DUF3072 family protein